MAVEARTRIIGSTAHQSLDNVCVIHGSHGVHRSRPQEYPELLASLNPHYAERFTPSNRSETIVTRARQAAFCWIVALVPRP